jgi:hypothetical protein
MPVENRNIIFNLNEMVALLALIEDKYPALVPNNISGLKIVEIIHTRDLANSFHDRKRRMLSLLTMTPKSDGVIFRALKPSLLNREKTLGFFVPDSVLLDAFLGICRSLKIVLPRSADKSILAEEFNIGLRISMDDSPLKLAA